MKPFAAPIARPAMMMPSIIWCGSISISGRSLHVPGSDSSALQMTYFGFGESLGTNDHFMPVGKPAPPRPRRFDFLTSSMIDSGVELFNDAIELHGREIFVEVVIDLHGRRPRASADAFDFLEGENAVGGGFFVADFQPLLGLLP